MTDTSPSDRAAVVIPGAGYRTDAPLLMYAGEAARARGAAIERVGWSTGGDAPRLATAERGPWVRAEVEPVVDRLAGDRPGARPVLIGKSLGSYAAAIAANRELPAVWLTPVLTDDWVVAQLRRATAPFLLVGGTGDRLWDGTRARALTEHVLEVADADHGMFVPGPLARSAEVLGRVTTAVESFLDAVVWPQ